MSTEADDDAAALAAFEDNGRDRAEADAPAAAPAPAPQEPPAATPEARAEPAPAAPDTPADDGKQHRVPVGELLTEREKRKQSDRLAAEAAANERTHRQRAEAAEARLEAIERAQRQPPPDPRRDPQGAVQHQLAEERLMRIDQRADFSERMAVITYGKELVDKAAAAALKAGVAHHFYVTSKDPYEDTVRWFKRQEVQSEIGGDLDGWKKKQTEAIRAQVLAELQGGGAPGSSSPRIPGSLASATAAGQQGAMPVTDEHMLGQIFDPERKDRKMLGRA